MKTTSISAAVVDAFDREFEAIAQLTEEKVLTEYPDLEATFGNDGLDRTREDIRFHLEYLRTALRMDNRDIFLDYMQWIKEFFGHLGLPEAMVLRSFELISEAIDERISQVDAGHINGIIKAALEKYPELPSKTYSFISPDNRLNVLAQQYINTLLRRNRHAAERLILEHVAEGTQVKDIYLHVFQPAQWEIGRLWQTNQISVAMEHFCTAATQLVMSRLYDHIFSSRKNGLKMVATSVSGELHELGIRMVSDFFEMEGWSTVYLGSNTPPAGVLDMVRETDADLLAVSATIPNNLSRVSDLIRFIRENTGGNKPRILVGGKPFNADPELWKRVKADGFGEDAEKAVEEGFRIAG